jgi:pimeloyl-ACP methyl ester carboxylesterase
MATLGGIDRTIRLRDGRTLGFAEWGSSDGFPTFGFHGTPNSRLVNFGAEVPLKTSVRLILPDRPGFGLSDAQHGRRLLDWASDVAELADGLEIDEFAVFGISGGGPHAAACGAALSGRVRAVGLVSSTGPGWAFEENASKMETAGARFRHEVVSRARIDQEGAVMSLRTYCIRELQDAVADGDAWLDNWALGAPTSDSEIIRRPAIREMYKQSVSEAAGRGPEPYVEEMCLLWLAPWGFDLEALSVPVRLWHGDADASAPIAVAKTIAGKIPDAVLHVLPGEGHLAAHAHAEEILSELATFA